MQPPEPPSLKDEIGKREPFESIEQEAYLNLMRTRSVLEGAMMGLFKEHGLSEATYNALRILRGEQRAGATGVPCQVIGERLIARVPDVTRLIDRLEQTGLAKRSRTAEDRRVVLVAITRKGLTLLESLDAPVIELHRRILSHLSQVELDELNRLLVKARHSDAS